MISLHQVVPDNLRIGTLAINLHSTEDGGTLSVRKVPLIGSMYFPSIKFEDDADDENTKVMIVELDNHGRMRWIQMSAEMAGQYVAVLVDGNYEFMWRVTRPAAAQERIMLIRGPWDDDMAERIVRGAPENYKKLNQR